MLVSPQTDIFSFSSCVSVRCFAVYCALSVATCHTDEIISEMCILAFVASSLPSLTRKKTTLLTKKAYKLHFGLNN